MELESKTELDIKNQRASLQNLVSDIVDEAKKQGADACEVAVTSSTGLSTTARLGDVESIEFNHGLEFGITVYRGQKVGTARTTDRSLKSIKTTVKSAYDIASYTQEDSCSGLANADLMAKTFQDLDIYYPWNIQSKEAIELAIKTEDAGRQFDSKITNSEGASVDAYTHCSVYGNSHGFMGDTLSSSQTISCVLIAKEKEEMKEDYWYSTAIDAADLQSAEEIGKIAAQKALAKLNSRKIKTTKSPVLFSSEISSNLLGCFLAAISGGSLYREESFLLNSLNQSIFPDWVRIHEQPHLKKSLGSGNFDADGLATYAKDFITNGVLANYLLSTYSARKLNMKSTANAGGVSNLFFSPNAGNQQELLKAMGTGLLVTSLIGQGVNLLTGDYSKGAEGFWVENGQIQYPVSEITIAANLKDMFANLVAAGSDYDLRKSRRVGSLLVDNMMIAGT